MAKEQKSLPDRSTQAARDGHMYEGHEYFVSYASIEQHEKDFGPLPAKQKSAWRSYLEARAALYESFEIEDS